MPKSRPARHWRSQPAEIGSARWPRSTRFCDSKPCLLGDQPAGVGPFLFAALPFAPARHGRKVEAERVCAEGGGIALELRRVARLLVGEEAFEVAAFAAAGLPVDYPQLTRGVAEGAVHYISRRAGAGACDAQAVFGLRLLLRPEQPAATLVGQRVAQS